MSEQQALPAYNFLLNNLVESRNSSIESENQYKRSLVQSQCEQNIGALQPHDRFKGLMSSQRDKPCQDKLNGAKSANGGSDITYANQNVAGLDQPMQQSQHLSFTASVDQQIGGSIASFVNNGRQRMHSPRPTERLEDPEDLQAVQQLDDNAQSVSDDEDPFMADELEPLPPMPPAPRLRPQKLGHTPKRNSENNLSLWFTENLPGQQTQIPKNDVIMGASGPQLLYLQPANPRLAPKPRYFSQRFSLSGVANQCPQELAELAQKQEACLKQYIKNNSEQIHNTTNSSSGRMTTQEIDEFLQSPVNTFLFKNHYFNRDSSVRE